MPDVPGWDVASYYSPSGRTEVGGDFYDAVPLGDGRLALFVGDVMGRGVDGGRGDGADAGGGARLHRGRPDPDARCSASWTGCSTQFPTDQLVTLVYLVVDPARDELVVANAGHPPPVLLRADGVDRAAARRRRRARSASLLAGPRSR